MPLPRRLAILAQYDPRGGLPEHVRIHLERLRDIANRTVLVSNSPLSDRAMKSAEKVCDRVLLRNNAGWDFAAWRDALAGEDESEWDWIVLTNSSVVGPLYPLAPIFSQMERPGLDFWGMVQNRHYRRHLQSYFLAFGRRVTESLPWREFWKNVENATSKRSVIREYEVGLTDMLRRRGFAFDSYIKDPVFPASLRLVRLDSFRLFRVPMSVNFVNKTVELHDQLIAAGMPYIKGSLLWGKDVDRLKSLSSIKSIRGIDYPWDEIGY